MRYSLFKYGTGVLYGMSTTISAVSPDTGPSTGGSAFVMTGVGFDPRQWDDLFTAGALDVTKWADLTMGSGTLTTGVDHLTLSSGAVPGSVAGIESLASWPDVQGEIRCTLPRYTTYPDSDVVCIALQLYVSATDYCMLSITCGTTAGTFSLNAEVYIAGALTESYTADWTYGTAMLKILRWGAAVYFIANGDVVFSTQEFIADVATMRVFVDNVAATYDVYNTNVEWFYFRPFAVFANQPVHDTVIVSDIRLRGTTPPSVNAMGVDASYAGLVACSVVGVGTYTLADAYLYYYLTGLALLDSTQQGTKMSLIGDDQVKTPDNAARGLGGGY